MGSIQLIFLPAGEKAILEILVEGMGRINFGKESDQTEKESPIGSL